MCATRDIPGQEPLKTPNPVPPKKCRDISTTSLKAIVTVFLVTSISIFVYSVSRPHFRPVWFRQPGFPDQTRYITQLNSDTSPTNISHIAFGIGGSTRTWPERKRYSELWWKPNTTRGFVFLDSKPDPKTPWPENSISYRISSEWRKFRHTSGSDSAVRIARVVADLFQVGLPNVRWFVMGDDDTVFFPENLVAVLAKYDHRKMHYVGGNSESVEQDVMHAYDMAFGGGGFAISYPLAAELVAAMDGCLNRYHYFYGSDQRVWACVGEIGVALTLERGFHQIDIRGDPYGLLAAHPIAPLVSLHHLDYVNPLFPNQTQLESLRTLMKAYHVDPARMLQQCFCYHRKHKWTISISWGYTVQLYPSLLTAKELETPLRTFHSWRSWSEGPFTFNTRKMRSDPCERPVIFYLDLVKDDGKGGTITTYKKSVVESEKKCEKSAYARALAVKSIVVSSPKLDPEEWKEGHRRDCCEINGSLRHETMRISIRRCKHWETITIGG